MPQVLIYTSAHCPYCIRAKALLDAKDTPYEEISVDGRPQQRQEMTQRSGRTSVPQIWIGQQHVGGCDDLYALEHKGALAAMLAG